MEKFVKTAQPAIPLSSTENQPPGRFRHPNPQKKKRSSIQAPTGDVERERELNARLEKLIKQDKVMLFMKGSPDAPRCGFSRKIVNILDDQDIKFSSFDILSDESVRQGIALAPIKSCPYA